MPGKEHEAGPLIKKMFPIAFRLSANPLKCREFLRGLVTSSYNCEMWNSQTVLILHYTVNVNYIFVVAYKLIAFHPLHPKLKNGTGYVV